jgi:porphobilinogen synthase
MFPITRFRRLRRSEAIRSLVQETRLSPSDLIAPLFIVPGNGVRNPIHSLEGQSHLSADEAVREVSAFLEAGIKSVVLFGLPEYKDDSGSSALRSDGVVQNAIRAIKARFPELVVCADVCFCEYTSHGHCGVLVKDDVDNDLTLRELEKQSLSLADAGADILAPSGMMDGAVKIIRQALDKEGHSEVAVMGYSAKFSSSFYGPFREAAGSTPAFGDRRSYQMDPANRNEALREIRADIEEGADIVMVKPALAYLDILRDARETFDLPLAAYSVSGEYAMVKSAARAGLIDGERMMMEVLLSMKRAGADLIITYFAHEAALRLQKL